MTPVPRRETKVAALAGDLLLQQLLLGGGAFARRLPDLVEKRADRFRSLRHRVGEAEVGVALVAQQSRSLGAERHDL